MSETYEKPMLGGCCVCLDERGWTENPLVYCDGQLCSVAVHQACYGIVKVPPGPWFCRKCESQERAAKVKCDLCPHRDGALKRTDAGGWAHVVCALYIPEVEFGNVSSMEPIVLDKVPQDRFHKSCYICEEENRSSKASTGACMSCAKQGCKYAFHVTCAQMSGILCEEASVGNTTKYCGYCKNHYAKLRKQMPHKSLSCTQVYRSAYSSDEFGSPEKKPLSANSLEGSRFGEFRTTVAATKYVPSKSEDTSIKELDTSKDNKQEDIGTGDSSQNTSTSIQMTTTQGSTTTSNSTISTQSPSSEQMAVAGILSNIHDSESEKPPSIDSDTTTSSFKPSLSYNENSNSGFTLSTLAEAASALSKQVEEETDGKKVNKIDDKSMLMPTVVLNKPVLPVAKTVHEKTEKHSKEKKSETHKRKSTGSKDKEHGNKKKNKDAKKMKSGDKKVKKEHKKHKEGKHAKVSNLPPVDPQSVGLANAPRHTVMSLSSVAASDQMEPMDDKSVGENNKIYTPDFTLDGLTAIEGFIEEQRKDSIKFFQEFGMSSDVASLLQKLQSIRNENRNLEETIDEMNHRKDQLLAIKARLSHPLTLLNNNKPQPQPSPRQQQQVQQQLHQQPTVINSPPSIGSQLLLQQRNIEQFKEQIQLHNQHKDNNNTHSINERFPQNKEVPIIQSNRDQGKNVMQYARDHTQHASHYNTTLTPQAQVLNNPQHSRDLTSYARDGAPQNKESMHYPTKLETDNNQLQRTVTPQSKDMFQHPQPNYPQTQQHPHYVPVYHHAPIPQQIFTQVTRT